jgi:hypothetical protein
MAALPPFATADDLQARVSWELSDMEKAQANRLLADASNLIRAAAGYQQITRVDNDQVTLRGSTSHLLRLPQRPVRDVTAVAGLDISQWRWDGGSTVERLDWCPWLGAVTVTYSHGLDVDDVGFQVAVSVACDSVKRCLINPDMLRQRSIDDYAETLADARATLLQGETDTIVAAFAGPQWGIS